MNMDRISCLPDSVLCCILSYLPTKEAVTTSILSRRWRHVWKDLEVIDLDESPFWSCLGRDARFDSYVNAILAQRNADSYPIKKFRLTCLKFTEELISTWAWLDAVIGPHLQELYFSLNVERRIFLPVAVYTCASLKSLVLKLHLSMDHGNVYLPSLKNLELDVIHADPSDFLSGCPVLENLKLIHDNMYPEPHAGYSYVPTIQMPRTLKSLTFEENSTLPEEINQREIYAPSLEYLHLKIGTLENTELQVSVIHFPKMVEAHLDVHLEGVEHVGWVPVLLHALCETKFLALKHYTTEYIFSAPDFVFPEFHHLLNLEVDVSCFNTNFLLNFLHNCHVLEDLAIRIWKGRYFRTVEYNGPTPPTMVPNCLLSHLKSLEFREYRDSPDEHEFIAYLLQRGLVLKTVTIHLKHDFNIETKYDIARGLSAIPRVSPICQLNFI
ncbi:hypothetical protein PIB30_086198 [Stylosanthes scabra]|uniref:F-box domain-containing protein n=1 Tax=Stylosanthes scabra TaxID=79078 RepID=A0ABU6WVV0_9FABA|nr:hypothetical protein [Stylosanthes scabra]